MSEKTWLEKQLLKRLQQERDEVAPIIDQVVDNVEEGIQQHREASYTSISQKAYRAITKTPAIEAFFYASLEEYDIPRGWVEVQPGSGHGGGYPTVKVGLTQLPDISLSDID